jgi:transcriptional regulator with AAA-type ATPase domain
MEIYQISSLLIQLQSLEARCQAFEERLGLLERFLDEICQRLAHSDNLN